MDFRGKLILAPLAGVTDTTFRRLCRENGADVVVTEMVSAKGLLCDPSRSGRYLDYDEAERPVGAQLFGPDPGEIAEGAAEVARRGFDFVDLNMGCPVRKVTGGGAGAAILSDPRRAGEIARAAVRAVRIPVTAKIRSGFGTEKDAYLAVARELFDAGVAAVTLHPRHRGQMFSGSADWGHIAALKKAFPGEIVIGNGDVRSPGDAARMFAQTGCDSVMVGRAAMGNPWIFAALKREMAAACGAAPGGSGGSPASGERLALILRHGEEMFLRQGMHGIREMRKHLAWYSRGVPGAAAFRAELPGVTDPDSFRAAVGRFF
ncbi:MAG: tRNA-dihydrouridine synthase [Deltaproteobacteria bacterium]|jgi:nifR3 family TIM-barrel protein|nr:tRNA-dihydrouridine synthase [Deltaproteobacteria bacterium]